ncbi:MAG: hypothetical protein ACRD3W_22375, partial [Terriglobales bacterium]
FSASPAFDAAFRNGLSGMTASEKQRYDYYVKFDATAPHGHEYEAAKQELMAQLFAALHTPEYQRTLTDEFLLNHFAKVVELMQSDSHHLSAPA